MTKLEVQRDAAYSKFDQAAAGNPYYDYWLCRSTSHYQYYDMLQKFAVDRGMDKNGKEFIAALQGMQEKMAAAESLFDADDLLFETQSNKEVAQSKLAYARTLVDEAVEDYKEFMKSRLDTGPKLKRRRGLGILAEDDDDG